MGRGLSSLQSRLLIAAYHNYVDESLSPAGTKPVLGSDLKVGVVHLHNIEGVRLLLGLPPSDRDRHWWLGHGRTSRSWTGRRDPISQIDDSKYLSAKSTVSRAFRSLEERGLVKRKRVGGGQKSGIQLTIEGIGVAKALTAEAAE